MFNLESEIPCVCGLLPREHGPDMKCLFENGRYTMRQILGDPEYGAPRGVRVDVDCCYRCRHWQKDDPPDGYHNGVCRCRDAARFAYYASYFCTRFERPK